MLSQIFGSPENEYLHRNTETDGRKDGRVEMRSMEGGVGDGVLRDYYYYWIMHTNDRPKALPNDGIIRDAVMII